MALRGAGVEMGVVSAAMAGKKRANHDRPPISDAKCDQVPEPERILPQISDGNL